MLAQDGAAVCDVGEAIMISNQSEFGSFGGPRLRADGGGKTEATGRRPPRALSPQLLIIFTQTISNPIKKSKVEDVAQIRKNRSFRGPKRG